MGKYLLYSWKYTEYLLKSFKCNLTLLLNQKVYIYKLLNYLKCAWLTGNLEC